MARAGCGRHQTVHGLSPSTVWSPFTEFCRTLASVKVSRRQSGQKSRFWWFWCHLVPFGALRRKIWESDDFFAISCASMQKSLETERKEPKRYPESDRDTHDMHHWWLAGGLLLSHSMPGMGGPRLPHRHQRQNPVFVGICQCKWAYR